MAWILLFFDTINGHNLCSQESTKAHEATRNLRENSCSFVDEKPQFVPAPGISDGTGRLQYPVVYHAPAILQLLDVKLLQPDGFFAPEARPAGERRRVRSAEDERRDVDVDFVYEPPVEQRR